MSAEERVVVMTGYRHIWCHDRSNNGACKSKIKWRLKVSTLNLNHGELVHEAQGKVPRLALAGLPAHVAAAGRSMPFPLQSGLARKRAALYAPTPV